jgi:hypothetical protein
MGEVKTITLRIESRIHGHETLTMPVSEAIGRIEQETASGKWLYVDGKYTSCDSADDKAALNETLTNARDVTLASQLVGGQ